MSEWYILENGEPKPVENLHEWADWMAANMPSRHLGSDVVGEAHVSTVFLGLDHSHGFGPPLLFETMVFGGPLDGEQERYLTTEQAINGHTAMCVAERLSAAMTRVATQVQEAVDSGAHFDQKAFAVEHLGDAPKWLRPLAFTVRSGRVSALEAVRQAWRKQCGSQTDVDELRPLLGFDWDGPVIE